MDGTLFRYWFFPKRWKRWSDGKRFSFIAMLILIAGGCSLLPLLLLPTRVGQGIFGYVAELLGMVFFLIVNISSALSGATLITRERELNTWEALQLSPIGMVAIVRGKWLARTLFAMGSVGLFVPFWLLFAAVVLSMNDGPERAYYTGEGNLPGGWIALRLGIFLGWLAIRILVHVVPFVSLGMLVSACTRKTRTAIALTAGLTVLVLPILLYFFLLSFSVFDANRNFAQAFALWPILPNSFEGYTAGAMISEHWRIDLLADLFWIAALPAVLLFLTLRACRRSERAPSKWKVTQMPHGV